MKTGQKTDLQNVAGKSEQNEQSPRSSSVVSDLRIKQSLFLWLRIRRKEQRHVEKATSILRTYGPLVH